MEYFFFTLKSSLLDFSRNKVRTFLTSLGILIGVMAVVLLTAFGLGLRAYIQQQFEDLGTNLIRIVPGQLFDEDGGFRSGGTPTFGGIRFTEGDVRAIQRIKEVKTVVPVFNTSLTVSARKEEQLSDIYMSNSDIFTALNVKAEFGSLFTELENEKRSKVAVLGFGIAEDLFGSPKKAVSEKIKINNQTFTVIGVGSEKGGGGFGGPDFDAYVYIPYKTGYIFNTDKEFALLIAQAVNEDSIPQAKIMIERTLLKEYDDDEFSLIEQDELLGAISSIFSVINTVLVAIAAISLLVGGIGIMNIMYVSVTERIKEIGIRRALGARRTDILYHFLMESVILSLFGGIGGLAVSYLVVFLIQRFFPAYIDLFSVLLALGVSSAIGVIFGVFPAKKAADLSPIEAIRYE